LIAICKIYERNKKAEIEKEKEENKNKTGPQGTPRPRNGKRTAAHLPSLRTGTRFSSFFG
jgi:hypothetical protein